MKKYGVFIIGIMVLTALVAFLLWQDEIPEKVTTPPPEETVSFVTDPVIFMCPQDTTVSIRYDEYAEHAEMTIGATVYTLTAERAASGARYVNEATGVQFWEHQDEARIAAPNFGGEVVCQLPNTNGETGEDMIRVEAPAAGETYPSPLSVSGEARGYWFFEATAPVAVVNWDGLIIGEGYITADGEWMTEDFVPFSGSIEYDLPVDSYSATGTVIFQRSNPSGLPENDAAVEIPVMLQPQQ